MNMTEQEIEAAAQEYQSWRQSESLRNWQTPIVEVVDHFHMVLAAVRLKDIDDPMVAVELTRMALEQRGVRA
jgi:hypothetical protein